MSDRISERPSVRIVAGPAGGTTGGGAVARRFWGMTARERLERGLARAGASVDANGSVLIRDDFIFDQALIPALLEQPGLVLIGADGEPVAAHLANPAQAGPVEAALSSGKAEAVPAELRCVDSGGLASTYNKSLRRRSPPYLMRVDSMPVVAIERRMFDGAYKGVTDFVTKRVWPWPAFHVTRLCARFGVSPNMVTGVSLLLVLLAMWFFWQGQFAFGLACAWGMCFLDTVDGKLARATLRSTPFGNIFDHGIDLIHPPFWYWAWYHGLVETNYGITDALLILSLGIVIVGYVLGRLQEGLFTWLHGIEIHIWRPVDSWFREITARRNPNLFILTLAVIFGAPREGFVLVAIWTILSFIFHTVRILQAYLAKAMGHPPVSWLSEPLK
ncbi:CDP-alcohol phosphatidyltransferase family protein [Dongia sp. agr-C8]